VGEDRSEVPQDRDKWGAFVRVVMKNFGFHEMRGNFLTSWGPVSLWGRTLMYGVNGIAIQCRSSCRTVQNFPLPQHHSAWWQEQILLLEHCARRRTKIQKSSNSTRNMNSSENFLIDAPAKLFPQIYCCLSHISFRLPSP